MAADFQSILSSPPGLAYAEGLKFFRGEGMINDALKRIAADLERNNIEYSVIGAVALNQHGYRRFTEAIDLLLTKEGLEEFRANPDGLGHRPAIEGVRKKFRTTEENIPIDIIISGEFPGNGLPKPVQFPEPNDFAVVIDGVKTISLEKLIQTETYFRHDRGRRVKSPGRRSGVDQIEKFGERYCGET